MDEFKKDLYNAFVDVMFKYRDYPIADLDHQNDVREVMNNVIDNFYNAYEEEDSE